MINVGICDDDLIFATKIETMLIKISKSQLIEMNIEVYSDGCELWNDIQNRNTFDLLYLDIEMLQVNGIDVARKIREKDMDVIIIYISSYENYFIQLFEVEPLRFIKVLYKIMLKDVLYFESSGRLIKIKGKDENGKFYGKLNMLEKKLENGKISFLRIHQSYLVNYRFIKEISFYKVVLYNGMELQISEDRQKSVREKYNVLIGGEVFDR